MSAPNALLYNTSTMGDVVVRGVGDALLFVRNWRIEPVEEPAFIWTRAYADPCSHAPELIDEDYSVVTVVICTYWTDFNTGRVMAVLTWNGHKHGLLVLTNCSENLDPWLVAFVFWLPPSGWDTHLNRASFGAFHASVTFP
jgi:hypothetical protein